MKSTLAFLFSSLVLIACSGEVADSTSSDELRAGKKGVACGENTCGQGDVCCNDSCGICTKPGGACPAVMCAPAPAPLPPPVVKCGQNTCDQGEVCCNASCGICTKPGGACIAIACAPVPPPPPPPPAVKCGPNTCDQGEVCCNESCGICTKPGGACIQLYCAPETGPKPPAPGPNACPAPVTSNLNCSQVVVWGKEAKTGKCCAYGTPCSVPPGIVGPLFYSEAECTGVAGGTTN